ncbi:hypothetical protein BGZ95_006428 [Linnemannia exigua]|uniref:F-box domain-containing protein n=1 Tax=Linnemannia exigua TaxID=604196 RepID=A0AAD4HBD4_9FUNG|nr:hypothetical protein BGZ95_006428 [Linnemannia exigua]
MLLPEILELIAPHLDIQSRLACLHVNRLWYSVFMPWLWHTISGDDENPWRRLFKPANYRGHRRGYHHVCCHGNSGNKDKKKDDDDCEPDDLRAFRLEQLKKHGQFIRNASIYDSWSVGLLLQTKTVTQLRSLVFYGYCHLEHTGLSAETLTELVDDDDVPVHLFMKKDDNRVALIRACWQLIVNNPNLTSIRFMSTTTQSMSSFYRPVSNDISSNNDTNGDTGGSGGGDNSNGLHLMPTDYLINVISNLPKLSHLRLMPSLSEWLLPALASSLLPTIRSYVYSSSDTSPLNNLMPSPSPCTTLETLQILPPIRVGHIRSIMSAFPALKSLEMYFCKADAADPPLLPHNPVTPGKTTLSSMDLIVHIGLEKIKFSEVHDLLRARIQFPNLKTFGGIGEIIDLRQLLLVLRSFPILEHLETMALKGQDSLRDSRLPIEKEPDWVHLKTLILGANLPRPRTMTRILAKMPNLVRLELKSITLDTLVHLSTAETCRHLEHVRFNIPQPHYKETNRLFVNCPNLKSIQGLGIAVLAEDVIAEPQWTCLGLQKLHCEIHGVPRLSQDQEKLWEEMHMDNADNNNINNINKSDGNMRQIAEQRQRSLSVQRQLCQQLARLTDLRYLNVGFPLRRYRQYGSSVVISTRLPSGGHENVRWHGRPVPDTLSFSLDSGLDELATLQRLNTFGFKAVNHQIGEDEVQWMARHWRHLEIMYGLDAHRNGVLCDEKADALGERLRELVPGVKLSVFRYQDSFD